MTLEGITVLNLSRLIAAPCAAIDIGAGHRSALEALGLPAAEIGAMQRAGVLAGAAPDAPGTTRSTGAQPS